MIRNDYNNEQMLKRRYNALVKVVTDMKGNNIAYQENPLYEVASDDQLFEIEKKLNIKLVSEYNHKDYLEYKYIATLLDDYIISAYYYLEEGNQVSDNTFAIARMLKATLDNELTVNRVEINEPYAYLKVSLIEELIKSLKKETNKDAVDVIIDKIFG